MKANELRVGNLVHYTETYYGDSVINGVEEKELVVEISKIMTYENIESNVCLHKYGSLKSIKEIKPIPINEDILLKCGFNRYAFTIDHNHVTGYIYGVEQNTFLIYKREDAFVLLTNYQANNRQFITAFKHFHTLQNVWFGLRKTELEIKL